MTYSGKHSPPADGRPITLKTFLWFLKFFMVFLFFFWNSNLWCPGGAWAIFWAVVCKNDFPKKKIKISHWLRRARKKNFSEKLTERDATEDQLTFAWIATFVFVNWTSSTTANTPNILIWFWRILSEINSSAKHASDTEKIKLKIEKKNAKKIRVEKWIVKYFKIIFKTKSRVEKIAASQIRMPKLKKKCEKARHHNHTTRDPWTKIF